MVDRGEIARCVAAAEHELPVMHLRRTSQLQAILEHAICDGDVICRLREHRAVHVLPDDDDQTGRQHR